MKKIKISIVSIFILFSLMGCSDSDNNEISNDNSDNEVTEVNTSESEPQEITVENQIVFDSNDIKITVTGFSSEDIFGPSLDVLIENNSTQNITVQTRNSSINGLMIESNISSDVAAGKKANDSITFFSSSLETANITTIKDIELFFHIFNTDTWNSIIDSEAITIQTNASSSFQQEIDDSGTIVYDSDGLKLVVKKLDSTESFWGADIYLYIENNSSNNVTIQTRDVSVNGFMIDPMFSSDILSGKKAYDTITFLESDLSDNGISDITNLELKFNIFELESWNTIIETDPISISFN